RTNRRVSSCQTSRYTPMSHSHIGHRHDLQPGTTALPPSPSDSRPADQRRCEMSKMPQPFRFRNGWRAQVTLRNGSRPAKTFATHEEAKAWIAEVLANNNGENLPLLGGPTQARLADMLDYYVRHVTVVKGGAYRKSTAPTITCSQPACRRLPCGKTRKGREKS